METCRICGSDKTLSKHGICSVCRETYFYCIKCGRVLTSAHRNQEGSPYCRSCIVGERAGISGKEYERLLDMQEGRCKICGINLSSIPSKTVHLDHCHQTGRVRGILCAKCNISVGFFEKNLRGNLEKVIEYLDSSFDARKPQKTVLEILVALTLPRLKKRFHEYEVRSSLRQVAARWKFVLTEQERSKIARTLGGNRYALTTRSLLDTIFEEILNDE